VTTFKASYPVHQRIRPLVRTSLQAINSERKQAMTVENNITKNDVAHVATLAKLKLDDAQLEKFTNQFEDIIDLVEQLNEVDTTNVEPTFNVTDQLNRMREDQAVRSGDKEALLNNAPDTEDGFIRVPAILDESEEA
jgi:aspartyl-tRNA(Asn)/glutamyl-tRNA(Gln) amidotransferase subunit C